MEDSLVHGNGQQVIATYDSIVLILVVMEDGLVQSLHYVDNLHLILS